MDQSLHFWKKIYWSAIFSGALTGFAINFLLNLLTLAVGVSVFTLTKANKTEFSFAGFIAFGLVAIVTMYVTGWVAGRLHPWTFTKKIWGALIGFISWSLLLIITIIIITNMIQFTAFHSNFTSQPNLVAIRITNNAPMLTETKEDTTFASPLDLNIEKTSKIISLNASVTFILFAL